MTGREGAVLYGRGMARRARGGAAATIAIGVLLLAGCGVGAQPVVTVLPTDGSPVATAAPVPSNSVVPVPGTSVPTATSDSGAIDCGGAPIVLDEGSASLVISGDCPDVQVNGAGLRVDASAAEVAALVLSGNGISVDLARAGRLSVRGNDMTVSAAEVSEFDVEGDRNTLSASGVVGNVSFRGNDNAVRAASVGQVSDAGDRNTVG